MKKTEVLDRIGTEVLLDTRWNTQRAIILGYGWRDLNAGTWRSGGRYTTHHYPGDPAPRGVAVAVQTPGPSQQWTAKVVRLQDLVDTTLDAHRAELVARRDENERLRAELTARRDRDAEVAKAALAVLETVLGRSVYVDFTGTVSLNADDLTKLAAFVESHNDVAMGV